MNEKVLKSITLFACCLVGLVCGTLYLYSAYGPQLSRQLGYSGQQASLVAFAGTIGMSVSGVPGSLLIDYKGFSVTCVIGGLCVAIGYLGLKDQYDDGVGQVALSVMFMFLTGVGSTINNSALITCCAMLFPKNQGIATSLPISTYGLSAFVFSTFGSLFFLDDTSGFLGMLGYSTLGVCLVALPWIYLAEKKSLGEKKSDAVPERSTTPALSIELQRMSVDGERFLGPHHDIDLSREIHRRAKPAQMKNMDIVKSLDFWILFSLVGIAVALGQTYIYSVGFMVRALLYDEDEHYIQNAQKSQVAVLSLFNCGGRLICGFLGDFIALKLKKSRLLMLCIPAVCLLIVQILCSMSTSTTNLWMLSGLNGVGYGFIWSSAPQILLEMFGTGPFSFGWGLINTAPILPTYLSTQLFGKIYDKNLEDFEGERVCLKGRGCYDETFHITAIIAIVTVGVSLWMNVKKRGTRYTPL